MNHHYEECVTETNKVSDFSESVSGSMDHFELQNRTQVNGKTFVTPRGIVLVGASDCTDAGKMGTEYMEREM